MSEYVNCGKCDAQCANAGKYNITIGWRCERYHEHEQTQADRIRAMSNEELADFLFEVYQDGIDCSASFNAGCRSKKYEYGAEWLESEVSE
jgi:hypothetical protein